MLDWLKNSKDVICQETKANSIICYQEHLCNVLDFMKDFYPRMLDDKNSRLDELFPGICKEISNQKDNIEKLIFCGLLVAIRNNIYYSFDLAKPPSRPTGDSNVEPEGAFQARDGFTESYKDNIALIRTRAKDSRLEIKEFSIGKRSKSIINLLYVSDIHNKDILDKISNRLNQIDIDSVTNMDDIAEAFQGNRLFPSYQYLGSPDLATRRLYNGEFIIIVDRLSITLALPVNIAISTRMAIDNISNSSFTFILRLIVLICLLLSTIFLGIFSSFMTYQADSLSIIWLSIIKQSNKGVALPVILGIFVVISLFELIYFICFRQAKATISSTVVLAAGLIIGNNLIASGIASVFVVAFSAFCFICSFVVSSNVTVISSISIIRLIFLISSLYLGIYGIIISSCILAYFMHNHKLFEVHYFYPFLPFDIGGIKNFFISSSSKKRKYRDKPLFVNNKRRRG